jgi:hypothetical protein
VPSTSSKDDFLAIANEANAEHSVEPIQPAARLRIVSKNSRGEEIVAGRPNPAAKVVIGEDDAEDPQGDLHPRHSQFLTAECDRPGRGSQNRESSQTSCVIPKKPSARIVLMQAQDLGSHHRNEGGHEPNRGG